MCVPNALLFVRVPQYIYDSKCFIYHNTTDIYNIYALIIFDNTTNTCSLEQLFIIYITTDMI